jgi:hypothetical protein
MKNQIFTYYDSLAGRQDDFEKLSLLVNQIEMLSEEAEKCDGIIYENGFPIFEYYVRNGNLFFSKLNE